MLRFPIGLLFNLALFGQQTGIFVVLPKARAVDISTKRAYAVQSQATLTGWLTERKIEFKTFWISNRVYIPHPTQQAVDELRSTGYTVEPEKEYHIPPPIQVRSNPVPPGIEWGVSMIRAPELWAQGVKGNGSLIGIIDTGVDAAHPAIAPRWTGLWFDPSNTCGGKVCDNVGHGTHVTGTIVGSDGVNQIGVAPEAKIIACKGCKFFDCPQSDLMACAEWVLDPHKEGSSRDRPVAVNNSWGGEGGDPWLQDVIATWKASGIFPVFAAGNQGDCNMVSSPADYPDALAVAANDSVKAIANFSSRGPGKGGVAQKPDVTAPGVDVRSSTPNNTYSVYSGTSMATPHVTGTVALLATKNRNISQIRAALEQTAVAQYSPACSPPQQTPNYSFGWGIIDAATAYAKLAQGGPMPEIVSFTATPTTISKGQVSTLAWTTKNATSATLNGVATAIQGSQSVKPEVSTSYTLLATSAAGSVWSTVAVIVTTPVNQPPTIKILDPAPYSQVPCGHPVKVRGQAIDPEDGDISDQITWWDSYPFWRAASATTLGLTGLGCDVGWHLIRADVVDGGGLTASATMYLEVVLPLATSPAVARGLKALTPITGWWGTCQVDVQAVAERFLKSLEKAARAVLPATGGK